MYVFYCLFSILTTKIRITSLTPTTTMSATSPSNSTTCITNAMQTCNHHNGRCVTHLPTPTNLTTRVTHRCVTHQHDAGCAPTPPPALPTSPAQPPWQPAASPTSKHWPCHHQQGRVREGTRLNCVHANRHARWYRRQSKGEVKENRTQGRSERASERIARSCSYSLYIAIIVDLLYILTDPYIPANPCKNRG